MANAALNAAIIAAAAQQDKAKTALLDQLIAAGATGPRAAAPLDLTEQGAPAILSYLIKAGHIRDAGGERYWVDRDAIEASKASAKKWVWIIIVAGISIGASVFALLA